MGSKGQTLVMFERWSQQVSQRKEGWMWRAREEKMRGIRAEAEGGASFFPPVGFLIH